MFRDVTVSVPAGQVVRLTGPPSSGKSTLLRVLAGAVRQSAGLVRTRPPVIGYVPMWFPPRPGFTVEEYLIRTCRLRGMTRIDAFQHASAAIAQWGLQQDVDTELTALNSDEARRLAVAEAMVDRPSLLVLDDPWLGLPGQYVTALATEVGMLADAGCIVLFTDRHHLAPSVQAHRELSLSGGVLFTPTG